jgi:hypothetical protein
MKLGLASSFAALAAAGCILTAASSSRADSDDEPAPRRRGFTMEGSLGLSFMQAPAIGGTPAVSGTDGIGLAPLSLGIGGFASQDVSLMLRMAGATWFYTRDGHGQQAGIGFYGLGVDVWLSKDAFVGAGAGFGLYGDNPLHELAAGRTAGVAFNARAGAVFARLYNGNTNFELVLDVFPADIAGQAVVGSALNLQIQYM